MSQYDGKTIAEIVYDYGYIRGDLVEPYAREQLVSIIERRMAEAWDEGHRTRQIRERDDCQCGAYYPGECACGKFGTGRIVTPNPYRSGTAS